MIFSCWCFLCWSYIFQNPDKREISHSILLCNIQKLCEFYSVAQVAFSCTDTIVVTLSSWFKVPHPLLPHLTFWYKSVSPLTALVYFSSLDSNLDAAGFEILVQELKDDPRPLFRFEISSSLLLLCSVTWQNPPSLHHPHCKPRIGTNTFE